EPVTIPRLRSGGEELNEAVSNLGVIWAGPKTAGRGNGMKRRVMVELTAGDGTVRTHEISTGASNTAECSAATVGLTLADGKGHWRNCSNTLFRRRRRNIAGNGGSALIVGRNGRSRMSA